MMYNAAVKTASEQLADFFSQYKIIRRKKGETLLRPGDTPQGAFFLVSGYVSQYSLSDDGEELTLVIFQPEDFFPIISTLHGTSYKYYLEPMTPVTLYCAPQQELVHFLKKNPEILLELTRKIVLRVGGLMARMEYLVFGNARSKVASIILICGERFGQKTTEGVAFPFPLTHKQIANLVGVSRETASIEIKHLENEKLIVYKGRQLIIKDWDGLKNKSLLSL